MILKTYARIFTEDLDASLAVLKPLVGRGPEMRVPFQDMEVATLGGFCFLAGPADSLKPFLGAVGPVIVDDIKATKVELEKAGVELTQPITEGPTGWNIFSRSPDGVVIEWLEWKPEVWSKLKRRPMLSNEQESFNQKANIHERYYYFVVR